MSVQRASQGSEHAMLEFICAGLVLCLLWTLFRGKTKLQLPPSPPGMPLLGHLGLMAPGRHHRLQKVAAELGPLFMIKLGYVPVVVASSPEMAREVLKSQDAALCSRPQLVIGEHICYRYKDIALAPHGEHWKKARRICLMELLTSRRIDSFRPLRMEELKCMLRRMSESAAEVVTLKQHLSDFGNNVMSRIVFSRAFFGVGDADEEAREFRSIIQELVEATGDFYLGDILPFKWVDWWKIRRLNKQHRKEDKFIQRLIDQHRADPDARKTKDFTDVLTSCYPKEEDDAVKAILLELIPAGSDTSNTTVEWAMAELLHKPHALRKAQEELDRVVGRDRLVEESDFQELKYVEAVLKEAFRLHPPVPMLMPHFAMEDCKVGGYDVQQGSWVLVNVFAIGRDPQVWENPLDFRPERFIGSSMDIKGRDYELLPFGSGRRGCPGVHLAMKTVMLALANLLHAFEWSLPPGVTSHPMLESNGGVNWMKSPLQATVHSRLSVLFAP